MQNILASYCVRNPADQVWRGRRSEGSQNAAGADAKNLESWLFESGASAALAADWETRRLAPEFADLRAVETHLFRTERRDVVAFEFGHGDGSACQQRARFGVKSRGIGDRRLLLTVDAVAESCLRTACPAADPDIVCLAARAVAGEVLAPPFDDPCPRADAWEGDGLDLVAYVAENLAERPELLVPCDGYWASPNRDGTVSHLRMQDPVRRLFDEFLAGPRPSVGDLAAAVREYVAPRLAATAAVTVADFTESPAAISASPSDFVLVQDVRALAFAEDGVAFGALSAAARRLVPEVGLVLTDAVAKSYTWAFRGELLSALARDGTEYGASWWAVVDGERRPVGAVAARDWDELPVTVLKPGFALVPVDGRSGRMCESADAARR